MTRTVRFASCLFVADDAERYAETRFDDGLIVPARPHLTEEYQRRAGELGYTGPDAAWEMCYLHEFAHTLLSETLGFPCSPTLRRVALGEEDRAVPFSELEESLVMGFQKYCNSLPPGIDLNRFFRNEAETEEARRRLLAFRNGG